MNFEAFDRLASLRGRLAASLMRASVPTDSGPPPATGGAPGPAHPPDPRRGARWGAPVLGPVDLVVTLCEATHHHGTGVLLCRLFGDGERMITVRSRDFYGGDQAFGAARFKLTQGDGPRHEIYEALLSEIGGADVRRILCIPYNSDDVRTALAAQDLFGVPLCTWVMDDQNVEAAGIPDGLLRELLGRSRIRLAISPELKQAYQTKFGMDFALAPPAVNDQHLLVEPAHPDPARLAQRRGLVFGNIWGERWLDDLLDALSGSGIPLDWHHGGGTPWMKIDPDRLRRSGITSRPFLPEAELVATLRASPFVLVPSGTFEGEDSHRFVARLSLPSRLPYLAATAGTPAIVLGHPDTAAARFVTRHGLGRVVPYRQAALVEAVQAMCTPEAQGRHRRAAASLAPALSSHGMGDWLWQSLAAGHVVDDRFGPLELEP